MPARDTVRLCIFGYFATARPRSGGIFAAHFDGSVPTASGNRAVELTLIDRRAGAGRRFAGPIECVDPLISAPLGRHADEIARELNVSERK